MNLSDALTNPDLRDKVAEVWQKFVAEAFPGGSADLLGDGQTAVTIMLAAQIAEDEKAYTDARSALDAMLLTQLDRVDVARSEAVMNILYAAIGLIRNQLPIIGTP